MSQTNAKNPETFKDAYQILQQNAQKLRSQEDPNIDELIPLVTESVKAFEVCKNRLNAVESVLNEALSGRQ